jgi:hypothetical protein
MPASRLSVRLQVWVGDMAAEKPRRDLWMPKNAANGMAMI